MSKFCGKVGYSVTGEIKPGVWSNSTIVEVDVVGDIIKNSNSLDNNSKVNQDIVINNQISIVASPEVTQNCQLIKYAIFWGTKWTVTNIDIQYPRLILTLGGKYNG